MGWRDPKRTRRSSPPRTDILPRDCRHSDMHDAEAALTAGSMLAARTHCARHAHPSRGADDAPRNQRFRVGLQPRGPRTRGFRGARNANRRARARLDTHEHCFLGQLAAHRRRSGGPPQLSASVDGWVAHSPVGRYQAGMYVESCKRWSRASPRIGGTRSGSPKPPPPPQRPVSFGAQLDAATLRACQRLPITRSTADPCGLRRGNHPASSCRCHERAGFVEAERSTTGPCKREHYAPIHLDAKVGAFGIRMSASGPYWMRFPGLRVLVRTPSAEVRSDARRSFQHFQHVARGVSGREHHRIGRKLAAVGQPHARHASLRACRRDH